MYSTRRLSSSQNSPETLRAPPDGPNSGYLVIKGEESETYSCCGLCKKSTILDLPLPQNKELTVRFIVHAGKTKVVMDDRVFLIPVLNQPLSSNRYYAISAHGEHIGKASTCSTEDDKVNCCFVPRVKDVKPKPLDPQNSYQQFELFHYTTCGSRSGFFARSIEHDGFPPSFLRRKGWIIYSKSTKNYNLEEANGLDSNLRSQLPRFDFSLSQKTSNPNLVGKWYTPFAFVKDGTELKDQAKGSPYYEITLEQRWERVFSCNNYGDKNFDISTEKEEAFINGVRKATWDDDKNAIDREGFVWFRSGEERVGLRHELVERMRWEEERGGYVRGKENQENISGKIEENAKVGFEWKEFGCFVMVERFNYKRIDGTLVLSCDFKHCHRMKNKWE